MITVALLANPIIRLGIQTQLAEGVAIVGEAALATELPRLIDLHPDVLLVEGEELSTAVLSPYLPSLPIPFDVILIGRRLAPPLVMARTLIQDGVKGLVWHEDRLSLSLMEAVTAVYRGDYFLSESVSKCLSPPIPPSPLTDRQMQILTAMALHPNQPYDVHAETLGISYATLRTHLRHIYKRLKVSNLTAALLYSFQQGWLPASLMMP